MERPSLGDLEMRVMKVVWARGRGTVHDVRADLRGGRKLAYTTILTTLRNLEKKGYLTHDVDGRSHVYIPAVAETEVAKRTLRELLDLVFDGSRLRLVDALFDEADLTAEEAKELRKLIRDAREGEGSDAS